MNSTMGPTAVSLRFLMSAMGGKRTLASLRIGFRGTLIEPLLRDQSPPYCAVQQTTRLFYRSLHNETAFRHDCALEAPSGRSAGRTGKHSASPTS